MVARGERYRTLEEIPVVVMTAWASPTTGSHERTLAAGESFTIAGSPSGTASAVYCEPERRGVGRELVPLADRIRFWSYRGFCLCIELRDIRERCERLGTEEEAGR